MGICIKYNDKTYFYPEKIEYDSFFEIVLTGGNETSGIYRRFEESDRAKKVFNEIGEAIAEGKILYIMPKE